MGTLKVNGDIESNYGGSISIKMTNGSLNTSINTSGGWARGWYITLNGSSVGPLIGGHGSGSNNSMSRIYFGDYDNPWMKIEPTGTVTATKFNGSGENLTNLNGSNIASGTVPISRLPVASLNSKGIVQLVNSINNTSNVDAATPNSVKTAYDMAITARDQEIGGRNLLANYIASGGNTTKIDNMSIQLNSNGTDTYFYVQTTVDLNTTQTYTISCEAQNVPSGTVWQFPVGQQSNSNFILTINRNGRCYGTGTFNKAITAGQNIILDDIGGRVTSDPPIILSNFKLEKGYKATDWTPSVENIQAQIDSKLNLAGGTMTGTIITPGNDSVVIKPAKHNYDQIGASDCKFWKVFATTFYGNLSGNADTATTASAVAWANITDKPSSFTPSSHSHSYIEYVDTRANNQSPNDLQAGLTIHLKTNGTDGLSDGGNYHAVVGIKDWGDYSGGPYGQLAITENHMWFRNSSSGTAWNSWRKLLDSSNYTYSSPKYKSYVMLPNTDSVEYASNLINDLFLGKGIDNTIMVNSSPKLKVSLIRSNITLIKGEEYIYHGIKAIYGNKDITKDKDLSLKFSINGKSFDDYKDLVYYITYRLDKGIYKIIYNINYKEEFIKLEQKVTIEEET